MGGRGFTSATNRRRESLRKTLQRQNAALADYDAAMTAAVGRADAEDERFTGMGIGRMTEQERQEYIDDDVWETLERQGFGNYTWEQLTELAEQRDFNKSELAKIEGGQLVFFNTTIKKL